MRERVDEPDQERDDQLQEVRVPEERPGQILQPVLTGRRRQRTGVFRVHAGEQKNRRQILLRLTGGHAKHQGNRRDDIVTRYKSQSSLTNKV